MTIWAEGNYQSVADHIAAIAEHTVAVADRRAPVRDAAVVDLACGTGSAARAAADRGARVTGVDLTPELLDIARARTDAPISWVTADAADTGLHAASFDAAVSNMGIIFVDPDRQVAEIERLLKPGAVLAFSAWSRMAVNPLSDPIAAVFGAPPPGAFTPDRWGEPDFVADRLTHGFEDIDIEAGTLHWQFPSLAAAMHFATEESPLHVAAFTHATPAQRDALTAAFEAAIRPHVDADGAHFDAPYVVVSARRR